LGFILILVAVSGSVWALFGALSMLLKVASEHDSFHVSFSFGRDSLGCDGFA